MAAMTGVPHRLALASGVSVAVREQGDPGGPAVLLLHAWVESADSFSRLMRLAPASLRLVAMDLRGHGSSDQPEDGYDVASLASDVVACLDSLGIASAVLVGSSSGGYVAQQVAVAHPDRVTGLVLLATPHSLRGRPAFADEVEGLADPISPAWVRESLTWFPVSQAVPDWYLEDRVADGLRLPARVWRASLAGLCESPVPTGVGEIRAPALVVWGERDTVVDRTQRDALCAAIPGARLVRYPETGHLVLWEQPARIVADLCAFLGELGLLPE